MSYRALKSEKIVETAETLNKRIEERFPGSGLSGVSSELLKISQEAKGQVEWISASHMTIRIFVWVLVAFVLLIPFSMFFTIGNLSTQFNNFGELIQTIEAGINDVAFIGIAIYFLFTIETRIKRKRALEAINQLRAIAHIIDMHQLTKDPDRIGENIVDTESSPARFKDAGSLVRYLDYCSELLSIVSKIAVLYVQHFPDPTTLESINEIETLTNGLSRKIWQKIMILKSHAR